MKISVLRKEHNKISSILMWSNFNMEKSKFSNLQPFELHKKLLDQYLEYCKFIEVKKYVNLCVYTIYILYRLVLS